MDKKNENIKRLDKLLGDNLNWAVKITAPNFGNATMYHKWRGDDQIWIHSGMVKDGDIYAHVINLAKEKNLSKLDFEIKKKRGNAYDKIPTSQLAEPKFSIDIDPGKNEPITPQPSIQGIPGYLGNPATGNIGLSMPEFLDLRDHKSLAERLQKELNDANTKLQETKAELEQIKKPTAQERLLNIVEANPAIAERALDMMDNFSKKLVPSSKAAALNSPAVVNPLDGLPESLVEPVKFLLDQNNEILNQKIHHIAYNIVYSDGFDQRINGLMKSIAEEQNAMQENQEVEQ